MPVTIYGIKVNGLWWCGENKFVQHPIAARWFDSMTIAELVGLRDLPDPRTAWTVEPIPERVAH